MRATSLLRVDPQVLGPSTAMSKPAPSEVVFSNLTLKKAQEAFDTLCRATKKNPKATVRQGRKGARWYVAVEVR